MYNHWKTAGLFMLLLGIGFIMIGLLLPYGIQLKISKQIEGQVKLERDMQHKWAQVPGENNERMTYKYTFNTPNNGEQEVELAISQRLQNPMMIESDSALDMMINRTYTPKTIPNINVKTPNLRGLSLLETIKNRDPSKIMLPALYDLIDSKEDMYYSYIYAYYMYEAAFWNETIVKDLVFYKFTGTPQQIALKKDKAYSDEELGFKTVKGLAIWLQVKQGNTALRTKLMNELGLSLIEIISVTNTDTNYFYTIFRLVHWRLGLANGCKSGCTPTNLMKVQHSTLGPLKNSMPDFAILKGVQPKDSVARLLSNNDTLPLDPEYGAFQANSQKYSGVGISPSQWETLFKRTSVFSIYQPTNMLMIFENDKGNVGMSDVTQRLDLGYMEQSYAFLGYLKNIRDVWAFQNGDKSVNQYSFLARSFLKNYLRTQIYEKAGDCANFKVNRAVFLNWTITVSNYTCADLISPSQYCSGYEIADFFPAAYYGRNSPQFIATMAEMKLDADTLESLVNGTQPKTYGGELIAMKRYVAISFSCASSEACTNDQLKEQQWYNSTYTLNPPQLIAGDGFICEPDQFIEQRAAIDKWGLSIDDLVTKESITLIYGEDKNEVPRSLLLDQYMQQYINDYSQPQFNQLLKDRYRIKNLKFWYDYMAHAIEMHLLNQEQTEFSISAQQIINGMILNDRMQILGQNFTDAQYEGYDRALANVTYLPRVVPNTELLEHNVQYHTGHRDVKRVRSYNRFVQKAQYYKALFFYDSKLAWPKQNTTKQIIPWASEQQVQGTDAIQFHPNIFDESLYVVDPIRYRSFEFKKNSKKIQSQLEVFEYRTAQNELEVNEATAAFYQTDKCYLNLGTIYNLPLFSTQGVDNNGNCILTDYLEVDQLSGFTTSYLFRDQFYVRQSPNRALPSVTQTSNTPLFTLERTYYRDPASIRQQFKSVDDMKSYNIKIILSFCISGGILGAAGIVILIVVGCLICKRKRADRDDYVFYENKEEDE